MRQQAGVGWVHYSCRRFVSRIVCRPSIVILEGCVEITFVREILGKSRKAGRRHDILGRALFKSLEKK